MNKKWRNNKAEFSSNLDIESTTSKRIKRTIAPCQTEILKPNMCFLLGIESARARTLKKKIQNTKQSEYFGYLTFSRMVLNGISRKKISDFEFAWLFVAYKDSLLIEICPKTRGGTPPRGRNRTRVGRGSLFKIMLPWPDALTDLQIWVQIWS